MPFALKYPKLFHLEVVVASK